MTNEASWRKMYRRQKVRKRHHQKSKIATMMRAIAAAFVALVAALSNLPASLAFHPPSRSWDISGLRECSTFHPSLPTASKRYLSTLSTTVLYAKASKKNKKKGTAPSASSSGGFGQATPEADKKEENDYAAFPALEPDVQETLIPFEGEVKDKGEELPDEIYGRLAEIYGFFDFNYLPPPDDLPPPQEEPEPASLGDLLATSPDKDEPISDMSDLLKPSAPADLSDMLGNATDDVAEEPTFLECLSSLPPFTDFHVLHVDPLVISIDNFFTDEECDRYVTMSEAPTSKSATAPEMTRSKTVGKDENAKAQRTSTTWFHHFKNVPELMAKASRLFGLDVIDFWEEPQTVRYRRNEKFTWHLDALAPSDELERQGGQRTATMLVYLTELKDEDGGATMFRDLKGPDGEMLRVRPKKGSALVFFPAASGIPNVPFDIRVLHCGEAVAADASQDKWIAQLWLRDNLNYKPSAPKGNSHEEAAEAIEEYCASQEK